MTHEWLPIETAPKARVVLVYCEPCVEAAMNTVTGWRIVNAPREFASVSPTHWMPLPEPPK